MTGDINKNITKITLGFYGTNSECSCTHKHLSIQVHGVFLKN